MEIVFLPTDVIAINNSSFGNCSNLKVVYGGENLIYIGPHALHGCSELMHFEMSNFLKYIGYRAFAESGIRNIKFPISINYVSAALCKDCSNLETVTFHDDIYGIGYSSFEGTKVSDLNCCSNLIYIDEDEAKRFGLEYENHNVTFEEEMKKEIGLCLKYSPLKRVRDKQVEMVDAIGKRKDFIVINYLTIPRRRNERDTSVIVYKDNITDDTRREIVSMLLRPTGYDVFEDFMHYEDDYKYFDRRMVIRPLTWWQMVLTGLADFSIVQRTIIEGYKLDYDFDVEEKEVEVEGEDEDFETWWELYGREYALEIEKLEETED